MCRTHPKSVGSSLRLFLVRVDKLQEIGSLVAQRAIGDFDYESAGAGYGQRRRTDPRIASHVLAALGEARTVINVGAGTGSYEPDDRHVV